MKDDQNMTSPSPVLNSSSTPSPILPKTPSSESVKVVVRCRPMTEKELRDGHTQIVEIDTQRGVIDLLHLPSSSQLKSQTNHNHDPTPPPVRKSFTFDAVYDWNCTQGDIYDETARPLVDSVLEGFNCTIFAYGQTGTGKTYTMEGIRDEPEKKGIIPNSFDHIFNHIARSSNQQYLVRASYLEIYQENIRDLLLKDQSKRLELKERADVGVYVENLTSFVCKSVKEIHHGMTIGNQNRSVGATNMNEHSSRSHAIFIITVEHSTLIGEDGQTHIRVGKLNLVDLAGSERQVKTGTTGMRQKEAIKINLSLSALGNVISSLVDPKVTHIPYRDSKLTRLLQDSLGGNSKTVMIANIGPASYNYEETMTTLRYANRAKNIKNKPRVNEDPKDALLREFQMEIERLKQLLLDKKKKKRKSSDSIDMSASLDSMTSSLGVENVSKLSAKIEAMESKLLTGGKNIIDHTNEQERQLEQRREEVAAQKRREREMLQKLEAKEENEWGVLKESYSSLQQEVDIKRRKLKKLSAKLQSVRGEITDVCEANATERRELEEVQTELIKELKLKYLIIDNFIHPEDRAKILSRSTYDEDSDEWKANKNRDQENLANNQLFFQRPFTHSASKSVCYPVSSYARIAATVGPVFRYKGENILETIDLVTPPSNVTDYSLPLVSPRVRAALDSVLTPEESEVSIDVSSISNNSSNSRDFRIIIDKKSGRPKTSLGSRSSSRPRTASSRSKSRSRDNNDLTDNHHPNDNRPDTGCHFPLGVMQRMT